MVEKFIKSFEENFKTPCTSVPVRCARWVPPVDQFAEIASPIPNYASPANERIIFYSSHNETLSPIIFGKIGGPH